MSSSSLSFFPLLSSSCLCFLYTMWSQQPIGTDFQLVSVCATKCFYPLASGDAFFSFESVLFTTHMIPPSCSLKEILHTFTILAVLLNVPECICFLCARLPVSINYTQFAFYINNAVCCHQRQAGVCIFAICFFVVKCPICSDSLPKLCLVMLNVWLREDMKHRSQPVWVHWRPVQMCWKGNLLAVGWGWERKREVVGKLLSSWKVVAIGSRSTARALCLTTWHSGSNHRDVKSFTE